MMRTIISAIALVAAGAIFFGYTQRTYDSSNAVKAEIAQYDSALTKSKELQDRKQTLLERYKNFSQSDIDRLEKLLPNHVDNVRLILDLDNLAGRHRLALQNVVVSAPATASESPTAAGSISSSKQGYDSLTLTFTTNATYTQFLQFLDDLQSSLRIVDLVSLKLSPNGTALDAGNAGDPSYTFDISIRTYWLK